MNVQHDVTPRLAATTILVRAREDQPEILLLKRGEHARFMPNAYVFAGGALDLNDESAEVYALCNGWIREGRPGAGRFNTPKTLAALKACGGGNFTRRRFTPNKAAVTKFVALMEGMGQAGFTAPAASLPPSPISVSAPVIASRP